MGIELELGFILVAAILGFSIFGRFEVETHPLRSILKWGLMSGLTIGLYQLVDHWALLLPVSMLGVGITFHMWWTRKNGIHPIKATPRKTYYALRGWADEV